jgi:prepilin-type N-terminal cleavage/methylation domain-containing protein
MKKIQWPGRRRRPQRPDALPKRNRGVTLIEVPIAMAILGFGLLAMAPLFTGAVRTNASSNQLTNANTLAREKMEELIGFPSTDARLAVPANANATGPTGTTSTGTGSVVIVNTVCDNDLPKWYKPSSGATSTASTSPGVGWFLYPYTRTYTVEQFQGDLTTRVLSPATYGVKLLTITVRPTSGPFPGLRQTTQSVYVRFRDASPN